MIIDCEVGKPGFRLTWTEVIISVQCGVAWKGNVVCLIEILRFSAV